MELTTGQSLALNKIGQWDRRGRFVMRGPAGSGKSTLMKEAIQLLGGETIALLAPTGKAAVRLTETTGQRAATVHSFIYNTYKKGKDLVFTPKGDYPEGGLAIVDESSMVTDRMSSDLERCFDGVLYIGDHYQLPPVNALDWFGSQTPQIELTEVMRQALDSPILSLVTSIRQGKPTPAQCESDELVIKQIVTTPELLAVDQVICATNKVRTALNELIRKNLGRSGPPTIGDRLINLRNIAKNKMYICNGAQGTVQEVHDSKLLIEFDSGERVWAEITFDEAKFDYKQGPRCKLLVDYAYCVTCHKAQGSEWDSVLVYDDSGYMPDVEDRRRWTYTALSRASKKLTWIRKT